MNFLANHLLSLILFTPTAAALVMLLLPKEKTTLLRNFALVASLIPFVLTLVVWAGFDPQPRADMPFQFVEKASWYSAIRASYHLGFPCRWFCLLPCSPPLPYWLHIVSRSGSNPT